MGISLQGTTKMSHLKSCMCKCLLYFLALGRQQYVKIHAFSQHISIPKHLMSDTNYMHHLNSSQETEGWRTKNTCLKCMGN